MNNFFHNKNVYTHIHICKRIYIKNSLTEFFFLCLIASKLNPHFICDYIYYCYELKH